MACRGGHFLRPDIVVNIDIVAAAITNTRETNTAIEPSALTSLHALWRRTGQRNLPVGPPALFCTFAKEAIMSAVWNKIESYDMIWRCKLVCAGKANKWPRP